MLAVVKTGAAEPVYNITVEGEHEYFANGILVSNCDAMLYIVRAMSPVYSPEENQPKPGSPEAIKREMAKERARIIKERERKQRGLYGS